jgi:uncharacterized protein (DUF433 family)/DNA-binding transcriptional MerR regulator
VTATTDATQEAFDAGVYSFATAARLIDGASARQLRYWVRSGLTPPTHPRDPARPWESHVLSFHDVISLEIVRRMRGLGVSLQKVRTLEAQLRTYRPQAQRPFAHELFWTDGVDGWFELEPGDTRLVQATGRDQRNLAWKPAIATFAEEIDYEAGTAVRWKPAEHVHIDPRRQFGDPVVAGTRVPVRTVLLNLEAGTVDQVAEWYGLSLAQVQAAHRFAAEHA